MLRFVLIPLIALISLQAQAETRFVLVHGALFTGRGWNKVQSELAKLGHASVAIDLPGRGGDRTPPHEINLHTTVTKLCSELERQPQPVILVGHSQGGAVITQALAACPSKIRALVYVAAVVPRRGELPFDRLSAKDNEMFDRCATFDDSAKLYRVNPQGPLREAFMADLSEKEAALWAAEMVSEPSEIGGTKLEYQEAVFTAKPKFYVETLRDLIISYDTQQKIKQGITFEKVFTLDSSHSPFLSQPRQLGAILDEVRLKLLGISREFR